MTTRSGKGRPTTMQPVQQTHTIGLDLGYRATKGVSDNGSITFPSVAGHSHEIKFKATEISAKYPGDQITDDQGEWFIGDLALKQVPQNELLMLQGRTANGDEFGMQFRRRMMFAALAKLFPYAHRDESAVEIAIATGLPVDHMQDAGVLKAALMGTYRIKANNADYVVHIGKVAVMPQPYGTIYGQMLMPDGTMNPHHTANRVGVLDIGGYTIDAALDDNGEYIDSESGSSESGVYTAQQRIAAVLEADFREKPSHEMIEKVLRTGKIKAFGEWHLYHEEVEDALKPLRDAAMSLISRLWKTGMGLDVIYVAGGGAELVYPLVKKAYRQAVLVENSQLSNARGYLSYARFQARQ